jgi:PadR family transcriptional regulator, regulatory protein PadR
MANTRKIQEKLTNNLLHTIILDTLQNRPMYGYEIMLKIRTTYGVLFGPSKMYPTLEKLESENLVKSQWILENRPKKVYELTREGLKVLSCSVNWLTQICNMLDKDSQELDQEMKCPLIID